jgi:hypothetical protein
LKKANSHAEPGLVLGKFVAIQRSATNPPKRRPSHRTRVSIGCSFRAA